MKTPMTDEEFDQVYAESECGGDRDQIIAYLLKQRNELLAELQRTTEALKEARRYIVLDDPEGFAAYEETGNQQFYARNTIERIAPRRAVTP
jgi:hypothetical protein